MDKRSCMAMLQLLSDLICGGILPYLSVCDLQALDTAFTNKYLRPQLHQVWKSYQYACMDEINYEEMRWLCSADVQVLALSLRGCEDHDEEQIVQTLSHICSLRRLRLAPIDLSDDMLCDLLKMWPQLEELRLMKECDGYSDDVMRCLRDHCPKLHTIDCFVTDDTVQSICDHCPQLLHIWLSTYHTITNASLSLIANTYPKLQSLHLSSDRITDDGLICLTDKCHELRSVNIRCRRRITSRGLTALWTANPNLMDVASRSNDSISDDVIIQLVQCCPLLQKLNISVCRRISDAAVIAVADHCPQLKSLNISSCYDLSDASLIALGQHCHELKSIILSNLKISDVGIAALAAGCPLLQEFYARATKISDTGVDALARGCRDLREVVVDYCNYVTFEGMSAIAKNCPLISHLVISGCACVDDAFLLVIAEHCRNLTVLNVSQTSISDVCAVQLVVASCRMLRTLFCYNCLKLDYCVDVVFCTSSRARQKIVGASARI